MATKGIVSKANISITLRNELIGSLRNTEDIIIKESTMSAAGRILPDYVDIKNAYGNPLLLKYIADAVWEVMNKRATCVAAAGNGGIPVAAILSEEHNLRLIIGRDKLKGHGRPTWMDGYMPTNHDSIVIYDDVLTTGKSINKIIKNITDTTTPNIPKFLEAIVAVKRGTEEMIAVNVPVKYLLTREELL